mmetsp:Transcript_30711/g.103480  ORF Transcript_30711/g.103480 Transcript_30711/m.103480 type:complete len:131 (+) Transcript_30711:62-454(+)
MAPAPPATRLQSFARGRAVRRALVYGVRADFVAICATLDGASPEAERGAKPKYARNWLCRPQFTPPARRDGKLSAGALSPPRPTRRQSESPNTSPQSPPPAVGFAQELEWARAALKSRVDYLESAHNTRP